MKQLAMIELIAGSAMTLAAQDAMIHNGSFNEHKAANQPCWWGKAWPKKQGTAVISDTTFRTAPGAFQLTNDNKKQFTLFQQHITLKPDTDYRLTCWMKGDKINGANDKNGARIYLFHKGRTFLDGSIAGKWQPATGTFDWKKMEMPFYTKEKKSFTLLVGLYHASGTVWFDDIEIKEVK